MAWKYILSVFCIFIVPLCCLGFVFFNKLKSITESEMSLSYHYIADQYVANVQYKLGIYANLLESVVANGMVQSIFRGQQDMGLMDTVPLSRAIAREINSLLFTSDREEVFSLFLYARHPSFPCDGRHLSNVDEAREEDWYRRIETGNDIQWFTYRTAGRKINILSAVKDMPNLDTSAGPYGSNLGFAKLDLKIDDIFLPNPVTCPLVWLLREKMK